MSCPICGGTCPEVVTHHITAGRLTVRALVLRQPGRALCGASLEGVDPDGPRRICRPCATKAKWTEAQIAAANAELNGSRS